MISAETQKMSELPLRGLELSSTRRARVRPLSDETGASAGAFDEKKKYRPSGDTYGECWVFAGSLMEGPMLVPEVQVPSALRKKT